MIVFRLATIWQFGQISMTNQDREKPNNTLISMSICPIERWNAKSWNTTGIDLLSDPPEGAETQPASIVSAFGVGLKKWYLGEHLNNATSLPNGKRFDLSASSVLEWEHDAGLTIPGVTLEAGGIKERIVLDSLPAPPQWAFGLQCAEGTLLNYQDEEAGRPESVVGSYSVIDPTGMKIAHLFRPKAVDDNGDECWLDIAAIWQPWGYRLIVSGAPAWFATAAYPVIVDPTLGYTSIGASSANRLYNQVWAYGYWTAPEDMACTSVVHYTGQGGSGASEATFGIYDRSGTPNNLLGDTAGYALPASPGWQDVPLDSVVNIGSGTDIYIAINTSNRFAQYWDAGTKTQYYGNSAYSSGTLPSSYPLTGSAASRDTSAYIIYGGAAEFRTEYFVSASPNPGTRWLLSP